MKILKTAKGKSLLITREDWERIGDEKGWLNVEAKKKQRWTKASPFKICSDIDDPKKKKRCVKEVSEKHEESKKD